MFFNSLCQIINKFLIIPAETTLSSIFKRWKITLQILKLETLFFQLFVVLYLHTIWKHKTNRGRLVLDKVLSNALLFTCMWRQ